MSVRIERIRPRSPKGEQPYQTKRGDYELADPSLGPEWHKAQNATRVKTLEEAADLIEHGGLAIRMFCPGKRPSLIRPSGLHIRR